MKVSVATTVSVVTPVYNGARYLDGLIASVREQRHAHIEHIVIDDGSTDAGATVGILRRHPHLRWWSQENKGAYATMNEGLLAATGDVVTFICSDDLYAGPHAIGNILGWWSRHPDCDGVCGQYACIDADGDIIMPRVHLLKRPRALVYYMNTIAHCSTFLDRRMMMDHNVVFDTSLRYGADGDWAIQMYKKGIRLGFPRDVVSCFRVHANQRTKDEGGLQIQRDRDEIACRYGVNRRIRGMIHLLQQLTMRSGACVDDLRSGDLRTATTRLLRGTFAAKRRKAPQRRAR